MYERPIIKWQGSLAELTADPAVFGHAGMAPFTAPITPDTPPGGGTPTGSGGGTTVGGGEFVPLDDGGVLGGAPGGGGEGAGGGAGGGGGDGDGGGVGNGGGGGGAGAGAGGGTGGGGGGGSLPFTGFAPAGIAFLGALLAAGGARARRMLRR